MMRGGLFRHGCYVSYRRDQAIVQRFVKDLAQGLSYELAPLLDLGVFVDQSFVDRSDSDAGAHFEMIADAMCHSVCMIVVFTPTYFSKSNSYCAREFLAMEQIERKRMSHLGQKMDPHRLIIPVVLRGADQLPTQMRDRWVLNFDRYLLGDNKVFRSPGFQKSIRDLAEYIFDRYRVFDQHQLDPDKECQGFRLPSTEEARDWLQSLPAMAPPSPFFSRSGE